MLSSNLEKALGRARKSVLDDPDHDLSPVHRWNVLHALNANKDRQNGRPIGALRLLSSEIDSTKYVLDLWDNWRPHDDSPHLLLSAAQSYFTTKWNREFAEGIYREHPENPMEESVYFIHAAASKSLLTAIRSDWTPDELLPEVLYECDTNQELEFPYGWDACYCASIAFSNGVPWVEGSNPTSRLAFWEWWLTKNVPAAFDLF